LPIHNFTINSNNLFVNFRWTFTFCVEKHRHKKFLYRPTGDVSLLSGHISYVPKSAPSIHFMTCIAFTLKLAVVNVKCDRTQNYRILFLSSKRFYKL
jgi:hypothetical protein